MPTVKLRAEQYWARGRGGITSPAGGHTTLPTGRQAAISRTPLRGVALLLLRLRSGQALRKAVQPSQTLSEIRGTDEAIGRLLEILRSKGSYGSTLLIIAGDHGV